MNKNKEKLIKILEYDFEKITKIRMIDKQARHLNLNGELLLSPTRVLNLFHPLPFYLWNKSKVKNATDFGSLVGIELTHRLYNNEVEIKNEKVKKVVDVLGNHLASVDLEPLITEKMLVSTEYKMFGFADLICWSESTQDAVVIEIKTKSAKDIKPKLEHSFQCEWYCSILSEIVALRGLKMNVRGIICIINRDELTVSLHPTDDKAKKLIDNFKALNVL